MTFNMPVNDRNMIEPVDMTAGDARLVLVPAMGGGIARLDVGGKPVLRPWSGDETDPFSLACNVLIPFSNRISGGGFTWRDTFYPLAPNVAGEQFPIHGNAFQRPWQITKTGPSALMILPDGNFGPWTYQAQQAFHLTPNTLDVRLTVTNRGRDPMPFGCGLHPWFPRDRETRLSFSAQAVWLEDKFHLPSELLQLSGNPEWSFEHPRKLPGTWINNCYAGWQGAARISQTDSAVSCTIHSDHILDYAVVFSPNRSANFFCFEPVSHAINSFHMEGPSGLTELASGESLTSTIVFSWD